MKNRKDGDDSVSDIDEEDADDRDKNETMNAERKKK